MTTYKPNAAAADRDCLDRLCTALNVAKRTVQRDECRLWTIQGKRGYLSTWGDGQTWMLTVNSTTPRRWNNIKRTLTAFPGLAEVTQDGDEEGVIRLMRLPTPGEAAEIRLVAGIRQSKLPPPNGRKFTRRGEGFQPRPRRFDGQPVRDTGEPPERVHDA